MQDLLSGAVYILHENYFVNEQYSSNVLKDAGLYTLLFKGK